jgi:hypothetical protein
MSGPWHVPAAISSRSVQGAAGIAVTAALLAGCTGGGSTPVSSGSGVSGAATAVSRPSPTPSPTATRRPARPAAMDAVSVEGAIAAVTYFMELYPYAYNTGDVSQLKELSHPDCIFCKSVTDHVQQMHAAGERQVGAATRVVSARGSEISPRHQYSVDARVEQEGFRVLDAGNHVVRQDSTTSAFKVFFVVSYEEDRWLVRESEFTVE